MNEKTTQDLDMMKVGVVFWGGWVGGGSVNSTSTQLYIFPHRKLFSDRLIQATANLCAGFMFVYIHIYRFHIGSYQDGRQLYI